MLVLVNGCSSRETCKVAVGTKLYNTDDLVYYGEIVEIENHHRFADGSISRAVKIQRSKDLKYEWDLYSTLVYAFSIDKCE